MRKHLKTIALMLTSLSLTMSGLLYIKSRSPAGVRLWFPRLVASALSPFTAITGAVGWLLGMMSDSPLAALMGLVSASASTRHVQRVTRPHAEFERVFGADWLERFPPERRLGLLKPRWSWQSWAQQALGRPVTVSPEPRWERDVPYVTVPGTDRKLLCDVWQPPLGVAPSGLALIYMHGSAWYLVDKDVGTRPMFRHLALQGHVVMDVAYRLYPEVRMADMVGDVKRAVAWMKSNAVRFGVNPARIVLAGGSAGGHLALMAAYAPRHPDLTPLDLKDADLSVRAVAAFYGPADLRANFEHVIQGMPPMRIQHQDELHPTSPHPVSMPWENSMITRWMRNRRGGEFERLGFSKQLPANWFEDLVGANPVSGQADLLDRLTLFSPITHVHPGCPPTLLLQGDDDLLVPAEATLRVRRKLQEAGVPVVCVIFLHTDHGFDLILPRYSPSAQVSLYDLDRFLALMV